MPKMAGLLEEIYSWHMDPFFQPKRGEVGIESPDGRRGNLFLKSKMLEEVDDGFLSRGALLKVDLRIYLLPAFLIGLHACGLGLLKNLLIRKNLFSILQQEITKQSEISNQTDRYTDRTVKKLRSLNLLFSCVFRIGRKFVHVGAEKIITLY